MIILSSQISSVKNYSINLHAICILLSWGVRGVYANNSPKISLVYWIGLKRRRRICLTEKKLGTGA